MVAAIFVHAGAGYHSVTNERVHLEACDEAARIAMRFLRVGGSATQAVEAALRCLEDKEVTNAGCGSNLNMDGVVECDATIVDHLGRSGACGAVPGIKNPISLAKLILDTSSMPLSLRRVPPNILVGYGAQRFAAEHGMPVVPNDQLVTKNARDRFLRWTDDLRRAGAKETMASTPGWHHAPKQQQFLSVPSEYERAAIPAGLPSQHDHATAILTATWNEGQPDSPHHGSPPLPSIDYTVPTNNRYMAPVSKSMPVPPYSSINLEKLTTPLGFMKQWQSRSGQISPKRPKLNNSLSDDRKVARDVGDPSSLNISKSGAHDGHESIEDDSLLRPIGVEDVSMSLGSAAADEFAASIIPTKTCTALTSIPSLEDASSAPIGQWTCSSASFDMVSDTVGAIAIDSHGHMAAGSSSGGIGIKHQGRIGPAALVGIGTAIIPTDPHDHDSRSVAAVTSGTGEHMATSFASAKCAERLYHMTRRTSSGGTADVEDERVAMEGFVLNDFMDHPGVRGQTSTGAIGVMAVKKTNTGVYLYFAHNTDSFALASMTAADQDPRCVMSRLGSHREVAQGARKM